MPDESAESAEAREALNATLKDVLSNGGWGKSVWNGVIKHLREDYDIDADLAWLANSALCMIEVCQLGALARKGIIGKETRETVTQIIHQLVRIALAAEKGDTESSDQLKALHKISYNRNYELPATVIKNLVDSYHISPHLARAWDIRDLMLDLSYVVEQTRADKSILECSVKLSTRDNARRFNEALYDRAAKHIKRNSTLQSLAIEIFIEDMEAEGISLDPRGLKRDLQKLKEWEAVNLNDPSDRLPLWSEVQYPRAYIPPIPIYSSEGWKQRWKRGDKK
jgi:hypothetical protein